MFLHHEGSQRVFSSLQSGPSAELETQTSKLGEGGHPALFFGLRPGGTAFRGLGGGKAPSGCLRDPCLLCDYQKMAGGEGAKRKVKGPEREGVKIRPAWSSAMK